MQLNYFAQVFQETIYVKFSPELKKNRPSNVEQWLREAAIKVC